MSLRFWTLAFAPLLIAAVCFGLEFREVTFAEWWSALRYAVAYIALHLGAGDPETYLSISDIADIPAWARPLYDATSGHCFYLIRSSFVACVICASLIFLFGTTIAAAIVVPFWLLPWIGSFLQDIRARCEQARKALQYIDECDESAKRLHFALKSLEQLVANHRASLVAIAGREALTKLPNATERELTGPHPGPITQDQERARPRKRDFDHSFEF